MFDAAPYARRHDDPRPGRDRARAGAGRSGPFVELPVARATVNLVARAVEDGILLEGRLPNGRLCRWTFSEITADALVWRGHESSDDGRTWFLDERMLVRRRLIQPA